VLVDRDHSAHTIAGPAATVAPLKAYRCEECGIAWCGCVHGERVRNKREREREREREVRETADDSQEEDTPVLVVQVCSVNS
jgi:hypothetical protein